MDRLKRVYEIEWSDPKFTRGGILPITKYNNVVWLCFMVSNSSASLSEAGGVCEEEDYDVLDTALREYKEESGDVFGELQVEDLIGHYTMECDWSVDILLPIKGNPWDYCDKFDRKFNGRGENATIMWLSLGQLKQIVNKRGMTFPRSETKIYNITKPVLDELISSIHLIDWDIVSDVTYDPNIRLNRCKMTQPKIKTEWEVHWNTEPSKIPFTDINFWGLRKYMAINDNAIAIASEKKDVFVLEGTENIEKVVKILYNDPAKYLSTPSDVKKFTDTGKNISTLTRVLRDKEIRNQFLRRIAKIRENETVDAVLEEAMLMMDTEYEAYMAIKNSGGGKDKTFFNARRAIYYHHINLVNRSLAKTCTRSYMRLRELLIDSEYDGKKVDPKIVDQSLRMMINTGILYHQIRDRTRSKHILALR